MKRKIPKVQGDGFSSKTTVLQTILGRVRQKLSLFGHTVAKETRPGIHGLQLRPSGRNKWKITSGPVPRNVYSLGLGSINKQFSEKPAAAAAKVTGSLVVSCLSAHTGKQRGLGNRELHIRALKKKSVLFPSFIVFKMIKQRLWKTMKAKAMEIKVMLCFWCCCPVPNCNLETQYCPAKLQWELSHWSFWSLIPSFSIQKRAGPMDIDKTCYVNLKLSTLLLEEGLLLVPVEHQFVGGRPLLVPDCSAQK